MGYGGLNKWISTRFTLSMENEQADARAREIKLSGTNGDREVSIFPVQLARSRIGNITGLIHTLLYVLTIHDGMIYATPGLC